MTAITIPILPSADFDVTVPWGAVEFHIIDVHGNLVRMGGFPPS